jgi:signal transduction histidine kinase
MRQRPRRDTFDIVTRAERIDRYVAVALVVLGQIELWVGHAIPGPKGLAVPLTLLLTSTVAWRRRAPLLAGVVAMACNITLIVVADSAGSSVAHAIAWMCGLYAIAVWTDTHGFLVGIGALVAGNAITLIPDATGIEDTWLFTVIPIAAMVLIRRAVRERQLRADMLAARAELLEREHELRAQEAVVEERARIARELHDLVAHNVSVMVIQAGAERHALPPEQAPTREALASIEQAGRQALADARRLLGMLRRDGDREDLAPQPRVDQIDVLIEQVQRAGLQVALAVEGEPRPLEPGIDLCAYRIVQEGLTNALKHAGRSRAEVVLRYAPDTLEVRVCDDGAAAAAVVDGAGQGLIGMRERVTLYGGELVAGPRAGGGFEIRARLPLA